MQIETKNISAAAADAIRAMIIDGRLADGARINEVHLAKALEISRTPLREGLMRLVAEGVVTTEPRRGFFVTPMTLDDFQQLYAIRPILDPAALALAGLPDATSIDALKRINDAMLAARSPSRAIDLDDQWHRKLLAHCPNTVLLDLIDQIIGRTRCYEHALFRETDNVWKAGDEHERIMAALREGDLDGACAGLKRNMQSGAEPIIEWLTHRNHQEDIAS
ncbi:MAG: GntR family transcriptional regulator [Pseudomonadota bacterium]